MVAVRVAFDPALPVVTTTEFTRNGRSFAQGESFGWRDLGMSEADLFNLWRAGLVAFQRKSVAVEPQPAAPQTPEPRPKHKRRW